MEIEIKCFFKNFFLNLCYFINENLYILIREIFLLMLNF